MSGSNGRACFLAAVVFCVAPPHLWSYTVSVGSVVADSGEEVRVPVSLDTVKGAANAGVDLVYDPQVLTLSSVEKGAVAQVLSDDFVVAQDAAAGRVSVNAFGTNDVTEARGGMLATLVFRTREGAAGLYSDVAVSNVRIGEKTGVKDLTAAAPMSVSNGMVRVMKVSSATDGIDVPSSMANRMRSLVADRLPMSAAAIKVVGQTDSVDSIAALGIAPRLTVVGSTAVAEYARPELSITDFDAETGLVKVKVVPGEGNELVEKPLVGSVLVYGAHNLGDPMKLVSVTEVDLSRYLRSDTIGEATICVDRGDCRFFKVKIDLAGNRADSSR